MQKYIFASKMKYASIIIISFVLVLQCNLCFGYCKPDKDPLAYTEKYISQNDTFSLASKYLLFNNCDSAILLYTQLLTPGRIEKANIHTSHIYNYLGKAYLCKKDLKGALETFYYALEVRLSLGDSLLIANSYSNIGMIYQTQSEYEKALKFHQNSYGIFKRNRSEIGVSNELNNIGNAQSSLGHYEIAKESFVQSLSIAQKLDDPDVRLDNHRDLANIYFELEQFETALYHMKKAESLSDSIVENNAVILANLQSDFELARLNLIKQQEIGHQKLLRTILSIILCFVVVIALLFIANQRNVNKRKEEEAQNLLNQLKLAKKQGVIDTFLSAHHKQEIPLNETKLQDYCNGKLNETDLKILHIIYLNPTTSNSIISEKINLSIPGIKSSFSKMYELFRIGENSRNKKITLAIKITELTQNK